LNHNLTTLLAAAGTPTEAVDGSLGGLLFYISIALFLSFLCSIWEATVLTSSVSYVEMMAEEGKRSGVIMRGIKDNVEKAISAILTLNTIAHTVGAAGAGAQAAAVFGSQWLGVISAVLTLLILIFSEIIPKTLGAVYWKQLLPFTAYGVRALIILLYPAVKAFELLSNLMTPSEKEPTITRSELGILAQIGGDEGTINKEEHLILRNLFRLDKLQVYDIMTPRIVVFMLQEDMSVGELMQDQRLLAHSRIPVYKENPDDVTGFVLRHEILSKVAEDQDSVSLKALRRPIQSIPESTSVAHVLKEFMTQSQHIFLVLDEYGGTAGIITMEDAFESLLGAEITDESDLAQDMRELARQRHSRKQKLMAELQKLP